VRHVRREWIHVALQAKQALLAPNQELAIHASVRGVARSAAFYFHGRVFEDKGSAFFRVAVSAGFGSVLAERCESGASVRVVAIGAFHQAFRQAVMGRQRELRLNVAVASKAQLRLGLLQEAVMEPAGLLWQSWYRKEVNLGDTQIDTLRIPGSLHQVSRMTVHAGDPVLHVGRMVKRRLIPAALMASETAL